MREKFIVNAKAANLHMKVIVYIRVGGGPNREHSIIHCLVRPPLALELRICSENRIETMIPTGRVLRIGQGQYHSLRSGTMPAHVLNPPVHL